MTNFPADRATALARLADFAPHAGRDYAAGRNYDDQTHVSVLSPYLRHRIITEQEVLTAVLRHHTPSAAEKFIAEVCWRTYWKGWLERRPTLWAGYQAELRKTLDDVQTQSGLRLEWEAACLGQTGIACFDHWAQELVTTGYLHNHARMWFASIWIHTLQLPWTLGADFFMRHLLDGDAASNTLSWRWVGGIQTMGKSYLARADNIAKYTNGRFTPTGLAHHPYPLDTAPHPPVGPVPQSDWIDPAKSSVHLITDDDIAATQPDMPTATYYNAAGRSPLATAPMIGEFVDPALTGHGPALADVGAITAWAVDQGAQQLVMNYTPVGPTADGLRGLRAALDAQGITLAVHIRDHDRTGWPASKAGFFKFKAVIPDILRLVADSREPQLGLV
jgi:deoxyribodipyrimidine photo-lyase